MDDMFSVHGRPKPGRPGAHRRVRAARHSAIAGTHTGVPGQQSAPGAAPAGDDEENMQMNSKVKDVLTTGEVAKICNVAPRTVSKWFDSGALRGYRIPGSKD